jgi:hypothetical protein
MKWVGTSPGEANDSRTTLRVSFETGLAHLHWGVPPAGFSHAVVGRIGRGRHLYPDALAEDGGSFLRGCQCHSR